MRHQVVESALIALAGGGAGALAAFLALDRVVAALPGSVPRLYEVRMNGAALVFATAAKAIAAMTAGLLPALRATRSDLRDVLTGLDPRATAGRREQRLRDAVVVVELALAVILLIGAGLFLRSLAALGAVELGIARGNVMTVRSYLAADRYADPDVARAALTRMLDGARALPGVESAAVASHLPLAGQGMTSGLSIFGGEQIGHPDRRAAFASYRRTTSKRSASRGCSGGDPSAPKTAPARRSSWSSTRSWRSAISRAARSAAGSRIAPSPAPAAMLTRYVAGMLFEVGPVDPLTRRYLPLRQLPQRHQSRPRRALPTAVATTRYLCISHLLGLMIG